MCIKESYNSWAEQYDSNKNKTRDLDIKSTIETLSRYNFKNVLELGCGTGKNTFWLLNKAERIIGLDFSTEMLKIAKEKVVSDKVEFKQSDLNKDWEIEDQFADLITSSLTLEHIEDLNHIFNQANQKLSENGLFFISELHPFKQYIGSKAKFKTENGVQELKVFIHHISDYVQSAEINGFSLVEIKEWFDEQSKREIPRLISFVFRKL
ncbi:MAG: class I SAM-dependent methyltransferase [Balneola sp.]|nr:class I SAM-dependent methyltransferase [Balneola sp.]MBO6650115.1 class I SAM-dependent methyltransferase [Balneola sp.]MBO6710478.1 class I SAM-dependent methyltransferase [Balneola sp.]MBO6799163.1 class I SAM-dependent methyltransferase [Balneola sp.]MBO6871003.1 class I SAM-dependent methyltransferase [Balneola sp.]